MIKGCQKRVLWVKNIDSDCFDGAFFIVSDKSEVKKRTEYSMVAEANRIISETPITNYFGIEKAEESNTSINLKATRIKWLILGFLLAVTVCGLLKIF